MISPYSLIPSTGYYYNKGPSVTVGLVCIRNFFALGRAVEGDVFSFHFLIWQSVSCPIIFIRTA